MQCNGSISANRLSSGFKYVIVKKDANGVILQPLGFKIYNVNRIERRNKRKGFLESKVLDKSISSILYNDKLFIVEKDNFDNAVTKKHKILPDRFSVGIITLPFKFRPQDEKTFEAQFNLNSTLNFRIGSLYTTYYYLQLGAGLGSVELNPNNSLGVGLNESINAATLTMFGGMMLQYKKVQTGAYLGFDHINNQNHYQWRNNGNLWLGFGVGYQLFNVDLGDRKKENK